jgi:2-polyprenyl-6-methoxyphenol hydroxylase-like FAD-dependent oxidoreductase
MDSASVLVIGGGIGGLTTAIALRQKGLSVEVVEKDPSWSVYGVGILQQANVVRAMAQLGLFEDYVGAGFGFDAVELFAPNGAHLATIPSPRVIRDYPPNIGIGRRALHKVLGDRTLAAGAKVRLGVTVDAFEDDAAGVNVQFSDGTCRRYDLVIGADGLYSRTRKQLFPEAPAPEFTGQSVWRYNLPRPPEIVNLHSYAGPRGIGLAPLSDTLMYMYLTTPEPGNPRFEREGLAAAMRDRLANVPPALAPLVEQIVDDAEVVYKPLEWLFLEHDWHKGRVALLGDAVHATTPHLGQGAGMAIEDSVVIAEEIARAATPEEAFRAYRERRYERCRYLVEASRSICYSQLGLAPPIDYAHVTREMLALTAQPI